MNWLASPWKLAHWAYMYPLGLAVAARRPQNAWTTWTLE